jgi:hypothetical protein
MASFNNNITAGSKIQQQIARAINFQDITNKAMSSAIIRLNSMKIEEGQASIETPKEETKKITTSTTSAQDTSIRVVTDKAPTTIASPPPKKEKKSTTTSYVNENRVLHAPAQPPGAGTGAGAVVGAGAGVAAVVEAGAGKGAAAVAGAGGAASAQKPPAAAATADKLPRRSMAVVKKSNTSPTAATTSATTTNTATNTATNTTTTAAGDGGEVRGAAAPSASSMPHLPVLKK